MLPSYHYVTPVQSIPLKSGFIFAHKQQRGACVVPTTHVVDGRMVVNFLEVDIVDSDAFFNLFLEELRAVILPPHTPDIRN